MEVVMAYLRSRGYNTKQINNLKFRVFWDVSAVYQALMMEAVCTSETSVYFNVTAQCYIPEDSKLHTHCCKNLKSHKLIT
jgi:hypothetical protein